MAKAKAESAELFCSPTCDFYEKSVPARALNMTAYEFRENKGAGAFNKILCTDVVEQDSGYQEVLCPMLKGGCSPDEFNDTLGAKVDSLS